MRRSHLLDGEALVAVEHDAARPFRVLSDQTVIQAVGTRFNVYRNPAGTIVSVVEGVVAISPAKTASMPARSRIEASAPPTTEGERLAAGEQARVSHDGEIFEIVKRDVEDLEQVVAWRDRRLVFRGDPLEAVAREFNRYNQVQIRLEGDAIRSKRLTGTFDADDPRSLALFLSRDASLEVRDNGVDEVVIRQR